MTAKASANFENSELAREKMWARIHLIPLLQAEEDRDLVRRRLADQARRAAGKNFKVYNSDRYVVPVVREDRAVPLGPMQSAGGLAPRRYILLTGRSRYVRPTFAAVPKDVTK